MDPCKGCVVDAMCKNPCDLFVRQVRDHFRKYRVHTWSAIFIDEIALRLKQGLIKLDTSARCYEWVDDKPMRKTR